MLKRLTIFAMATMAFAALPAATEIAGAQVGYARAGEDSNDSRSGALCSKGELSPMHLYANGRSAGAHNKNDIAACWFRLSAEASVEAEGPMTVIWASTRDLGFLYENGNGVPQDYVLAYKWHSISEGYGSIISLNSRQYLENIMTPDQIAEAQRLAEVWLAERR